MKIDEYANIIAILYLLKKYGRLGRYQLSKMLGIGEGVVRKILERLRDEGYLNTIRGGSSLTELGKKLYEDLLRKFNIKKICEIDIKSLIGKEYYSVGLCCKLNEVKVLSLRDSVVRAGADGALIIIYENGILKLPYVSNDIKRDFPSLANSLIKEFNPIDKEIIVISFSKDFGKALLSVLKAIISAKMKIF